MPTRKKPTQVALAGGDAAQTANTAPVRSSTRQKVAKAEKSAEPSSAPTKKRKTADSAAVKENPPAKRARATKQVKSNDDDESKVRPGPSKKTKSRGKAASSSTLSVNETSQPATAKAQSPSPPPELTEPKQERVEELFTKYADEDDKDVISAEGLESLYGDAGIALDGALPWIMAWRFGAEEMLRFTRDEWKRGMNALHSDSLEGLKNALSKLDSLIIHDKPTRTKGKKSELNLCATDTASAFSELYNFCFTLGKKGQARVIEMEIAVAFWSVLLVPKYPIMSEIMEFIGEKGTYKATTKDQWSMIYEFCRTVKPSLDGYDNDGAWPTILDDFVIWKKERTSQSA